jgi:hypothetical protein
MTAASSCQSLPFLSALDAGKMIGTPIAKVLEKIRKVRKEVADEASEQRGSYSKVIRAWGKAPDGKTPEAGNPNQLAHKENFNGFGCPE